MEMAGHGGFWGSARGVFSGGGDVLDVAVVHLWLGDGATNDALAADFFDLNEAGFQVRVKSGPGSRLERANLTDGEVSHFKAILNRDERLF
jgi:hypothetical protein